MDIGLLQRQIVDGFKVRDDVYASIEELTKHCQRTNACDMIPYIQSLVSRLEILKEHEQNIAINVFEMEGDDEQTSQTNS